MWWYTVKLSDEPEKIVYSYGFESYNQTGEVEYYPKTEEFNVIKAADGDGGYGLTRFCSHLWGIITRENAPAERMIATG